MAILHQPHPKNTKLKRVSRLVILPDYQGIGLGTKFLNEIAKIYVNEGYDFSIITSAKNLIASLRKRNNWVLFRYSKHKNVTDLSSKIDRFRKVRDTYTASFMFKR